MSTPGAARGRYRDALRHRDLRLLMAAFLVDQIGSWSYLVVISVYVFDRTHSTQWLAASAVCRWGPSLLLASYGGVLADRYQRVTVLVVSALASAVLMAGMAVVVASDAPVGFVLAISALAAVALAPYQPAAGALIPEVVGEKDLAAANSHLLRAGEPRRRRRAGYRRPAAADRPARHRRGDQRGQLRHRGRRDHPAAGSFPRWRGRRRRHRPAAGGRAEGAGRAAGRGGGHLVLRAGLRRLRRQPPCCTSRCRSGWAPAPTATATCWPGRRSVACSALAWRTG